MKIHNQLSLCVWIDEDMHLRHLEFFPIFLAWLARLILNGISGCLPKYSSNESMIIRDFSFSCLDTSRPGLPCESTCLTELVVS